MVDNQCLTSDDDMLYDQVKFARKRDPTEKDKRAFKLSMNSSEG